MTVADMQAPFDFVKRVRDRGSAIQGTVVRLNTVLDELERIETHVEDPALKERARALNADIDSMASAPYKHEERGDHAHLGPELTTSYARIGLMLHSSDYQPPASPPPRRGGRIFSPSTRNE